MGGMVAVAVAVAATQLQLQQGNLQFKFFGSRFMRLMFLMMLMLLSMFCSLLGFDLCLSAAYLSCEGVLLVTSVLDRLMGRCRPRRRASRGTSSTPPPPPPPSPLAVLTSPVTVLVAVLPTAQWPRETRGQSLTGLHSFGGDRSPHGGGAPGGLLLDGLSGLEFLRAGQVHVQSSQQRCGLGGLQPRDLRNVFFSAGVTGLSWSSSLSISLLVQP